MNKAIIAVIIVLSIVAILWSNIGTFRMKQDRYLWPEEFKQLCEEKE